MQQCCIARLKSNKYKQCSKKTSNNSDLCSTHIKDKNILKFNEPLFTDNIVYDGIINNINVDIDLMQWSLYRFHKNYLGNKNLILYNYIILKQQLTYYYNNINSIIKIQSLYRKYIINKLNYIKGINYILKEKSLIVNETDFYTCDNINTINYNYLLCYKDIDNFIYVFDIRSLHLLILNNNNTNPYNRKQFTDEFLYNIKFIVSYLLKNNISIEFINNNILTIQQKLNQTVLAIFQKIDKYYYTNISWFLDLKNNQLRKFYIILEDIWNYRAQLTYENKTNIIQNKSIFTKIHYISNITITNKNILDIQYLILDDINILVSSGKTKEDCGLGALYILIALSFVSNECYTSMPWLNQILDNMTY